MKFEELSNHLTHLDDRLCTVRHTDKVGNTSRTYIKYRLPNVILSIAYIEEQRPETYLINEGNASRVLTSEGIDCLLDILDEYVNVSPERRLAEWVL